MQGQMEGAMSHPTCSSKTQWDFYLSSLWFLHIYGLGGILVGLCAASVFVCMHACVCVRVCVLAQAHLPMCADAWDVHAQA